VKLKKANFLPFLSKGMHRASSLYRVFTLQYLHYVNACALRLEEFNETIVALRTSLLIHFVYPYERKITIVYYA
jgi:hypothetical protein